jgi:adenylate cyclase class 2
LPAPAHKPHPPRYHYPARLSASNREIEIKLRVASARAARRLLKAAGFRVRRRRVFEDNRIFDTPELVLRRAGTVLRVREAGKISTLTYKGPMAGGRHKSREELEIEISDAATAAVILERLRFHPVFRCQKYRTEYFQPGAHGIVTLDETPIGCFLEIEGTPRWIDRTARRLGFQELDYITASYGRLYQEFSKARGIAPGDMIFAS